MNGSTDASSGERNGGAESLLLLADDDLQEWLKRHLLGLDGTLPVSFENSRAHAVAVCFRKLDRSVQQRLQRAVVQLLSEVSTGRGEWDEQAVRELLSLVMDLKPLEARPLLETWARAGNVFMESPDARERILQSLVEFEIPMDQRFWQHQLSQDEERFAGLVFAGLSAISPDLAVELLPRLPNSEAAGKHVVTTLPAMLHQVGGNQREFIAGLIKTLPACQPLLAEPIKDFLRALDTGAAERDATSTQLVRQAQQGDTASWELLVKSYAPLLVNWLRRWSLGPEDREDLAQEVFRKVLQSINQFDPFRPGSSFRGWLSTITQNTVRDHFRRVSGKPAAQGGTTNIQRVQELADQSQSDAMSVELDDTVAQRSLELVRARVSHETWQAFWDTTIEGCPVADVAARLGKSEGAVRKAKSRVIQDIRRQKAELSPD